MDHRMKIFLFLLKKMQKLKLLVILFMLHTSKVENVNPDGDDQTF